MVKEKVLVDCRLSPLFRCDKNDIKRMYSEDITSYYCNVCHSTYDVKILGTNICPNCKRVGRNSEMKFKKTWYRKCIKCGKQY